jgi:hypothetical protein
MCRIRNGSHAPEFHESRVAASFGPNRPARLAGVTSDVKEEGDDSVFDIGHESIVLVRQKDGSIKAFQQRVSAPR